MRLLIVKNNDKYALKLQQDLRQFYVVDLVNSARDAILDVGSADYDLIILGLNLLDMTTEAFYAKIRSDGIKTPVMIISNKNEASRKIALLKMGASDFVTIPYQLEELHARICNTLEQKCDCTMPGKVVVGDIVLDPFTRSVQRGGKNIDLRRKEYELLEYMMRNQRHTLTRSMIVQHIWDNDENLWANVVDVHIKHLRDKIDRPFGSDLIKTVHGVGYKLDASELKKKEKSYSNR